MLPGNKNNNQGHHAASQAKPSQAKPSQAKPSQAKPSSSFDFLAMTHFHEQRERYTFTKRVASRFIQNLPKLSIGFTRAILGTFLFAANPLAAQVGDVTWAAHNQTMSVNLGVVQHDYSENDPYGL